MDQEVEAIAQATGARFVLVAVHIARWFDELPPWDAPPVFGKRPFGHGAPATLQSILDIIDHLRSSGLVSSPDCPTILGGYSLAGLFALWAGYQHPFDGIVAASPSIWYPQWLDYAALHTPLSAAFYLSSGDREARSRTLIMTTVSQCIRRQHDLLIASSTPSTLEWNEGNHFQDNGLRTAKRLRLGHQQNTDSLTLEGTQLLGTNRQGKRENNKYNLYNMLMIYREALLLVVKVVQVIFPCIHVELTSMIFPSIQPRFSVL